MIVDDEPLVRASLQSFLNWEKEGYTFVSEASNGIEALEELERQPVDLILLDIHMPGMDGLEFLEKLEGRTEKPGVIVLSANDHYSSVRKAFQLGALDYILKSDLDEKTLLDLLNSKREEIQPVKGSTPSLQFRDLEYLKQKLILDLFELRNPELTLSMLSELGIEITFPMRICYLWTEEKIEANIIGMLRLNAAQFLKKQNAGVCSFVTPDGEVFFLLEAGKNSEAAMVYCDSFCRDFSGIVKDSIDISLEYALSSQCEVLQELPGQYRYTLSLKTVESRMIRRAKKYIHKNFSSSTLSLEEVSEYVQISKAHLSAQFSKETGTTFRDYLTKVRIDHAKKLLLETSLKVYEISGKVGYPNVEHFSRIFKKTVGTTANRFVNQKRTNPVKDQ